MKRAASEHAKRMKKSEENEKPTRKKRRVCSVRRFRVNQDGSRTPLAPAQPATTKNADVKGGLGPTIQFVNTTKASSGPKKFSFYGEPDTVTQHESVKTHSIMMGNKRISFMRVKSPKGR